jgi:hypothetical protein
MHLGKNNSRRDYEIEDVSTGEKKLIEKTECEKVQCVLIRSDLKWEDQVRYAATKANRVLGMLKKTFMCIETVICGKSCTHLLLDSIWNMQFKFGILTWLILN